MQELEVERNVEEAESGTSEHHGVVDSEDEFFSKS